MTMRADVGKLDMPYRAKRDAQSPAEYANPYEHHRRPVSALTRLGYLVALVLVLAAIYMGAK